MEGVHQGRGRRWLVIAAAALIGATILGVGLSYLFLVVRDEPLTRGMWGGIFPAPQVSTHHAVDYVDGELVSVDVSLLNDGRFGLTVTGVHTDAGWQGLARIVGVRTAVMGGRAPCCIVDDAATWAAPGFRPFHLDPGTEGAVVLHVALGNCRNAQVGVRSVVDEITVDYTVLGWPHTTAVQLPYPADVRYTSADICP
jgi:hypothetical protein